MLFTVVAGAGSWLDFFQVTLGGFLVGLVAAVLVSRWLSRVFNDAMVEITATLLLAYSVMLLSEHVLEVSGVMALVAAGLYMGGPGRTVISPEVSHFLHRFWEVLSYVANTLIFFLVGLVVAAQLSSFPVVLGAFAVVMVVRVVVLLGFRPLLGLSLGQTSVMAWGGLRGAVALALALVAREIPGLPGEEILTVTAGVVLLSIVVNGSTLGWLLRRLGMDRPPPGLRLANLAVRASALRQLEARLSEAAATRELRTAQWEEVFADLRDRLAAVEAEIASVRGELALDSDRVLGYWQQVLEIERQAYWRAFSQGALGGPATSLLDHQVDVHLDRLEEGRAFAWAAPRGSLGFRHEVARGRSLGAEAVLRSLEGVDEDVRVEVERVYRSAQREGREMLEDLRVNLPEICRAIETRLARRVELNMERETYLSLARRGALDPGAAREVVAEVEQAMKRLAVGAYAGELPETADVVRQAALFRGLSEKALLELARITRERVLAPGEVLFREGDAGDSVFVVARGAVLVYREGVLVEVLGGGDVFGEMALLSGAPRSSSIKAGTTVVLGEITREDFERFLASEAGLREAIWRTFARRVYEDFMRSRGVDREARRERFASGSVVEVAAGEVVPGSSVFVALGGVEGGERLVPGPVRAVERSLVVRWP